MPKSVSMEKCPTSPRVNMIFLKKGRFVSDVYLPNSIFFLGARLEGQRLWIWKSSWGLAESYIWSDYLGIHTFTLYKFTLSIDFNFTLTDRIFGKMSYYPERSVWHLPITSQTLHLPIKFLVFDLFFFERNKKYRTVELITFWMHTNVWVPKKISCCFLKMH